MAELTWRNGVPRPLKPNGNFEAARLADGSLRIDQADPRILVSDEFLLQVEEGEADPQVAFDGDVLKIHGTNRTVVYRLGEEIPDLCARYAEWPD